MTRRELAKLVADSLPSRLRSKLSRDDLEHIMTVAFDHILVALASGEQVKIGKFGTWVPYYRTGRRMRCNLTGKETVSKDRIGVRFRPAVSKRDMFALD